jgi:large subunit ribosomal protein L19
MNKGQILRTIESEQLKKDRSKFNVGDTVRVHTIVKEGDKERVQIFSGIVIARRGSLINETFTVRRISYGEGVERVFPVHSPRIAKIEVEQEGSVRRSKLYYLRDRKGKEAMYVKPKVRTQSKSAAKRKTKAKAAASAEPADSAAELSAETAS